MFKKTTLCDFAKHIHHWNAYDKYSHPYYKQNIKTGAGTSRTEVLTTLRGKFDLHVIYKLFLPPLTSEL
jgi:hypothetical protein